MADSGDLLTAVAQAMSKDELTVMEELTLSVQQRVLVRMVRVMLIGEFMLDSNLDEKDLLGDLEGAIEKMSTKSLVQFDRNIPVLLRSMNRVIEALSKSRDAVDVALQDHAGLPDDDDEEV